MDIPTLDKCPRYNLYIGGFISLRRPQALKNANITHIVSVLDWKFDDDTPLVRGYQHLHIPVDDVADENLIEWFPRSNQFIHQGLNYWRNSHGNDVARTSVEGGKESGVLIHCAMGKSRSATILLAYLLWASRQPPSSRTAAISSQSSAPVDPSAPTFDPLTTDMVPLPTKPFSVVEALMLLRQGRAIAEPNEGFMDQLHMFESMGCPTTESDLKKHKIYRRWMNKRFVEESLRVNMAPEMDMIKFEDESDDDDDAAGADEREPPKDNETRNEGQVKGKRVTSVAPGIKAPDGTLSSLSPSTGSPTSTTNTNTQSQTRMTLKCRKCRHVLATTPFLVSHTPPPHADPAFYNNNDNKDENNNNIVGSPSPQCAHIFLHPLSWMRGVLSEGAMEGRLSCPNAKCNSNIGKFAWTGLRCSCGGWVTPGFGVGRAKVDEVVSSDAAKSRSQGTAGTITSGGGGGLRLPPNMRKMGGNL